MHYSNKGATGQLFEICKSLLAIMVASILAVSVSLPVQAFGATGKDISMAQVNDDDGIRNQLVEVIVGAQEDSGKWAGYSSITNFENACRDYLNGLSDGNRILPTTQKGSDDSFNPFYIVYSYKAEPTFKLTIGDQTLTPGVDYTVSYQNQSNVTDDAKAIVTGIGDYAGSSREIAYSIVGYKTVGYYIDCDAEGNQAENDTPYCHWQHDLTWPNMIIDYSWTTHVGGFGSPFVLNKNKNAYTAMITVNSILSMGNEYIATDTNPLDIHPSVTASESDSYYTAHVTESERAYGTPVDTAHIWFTDSGKEYYPNLCDWEMQSAHCWWSPKTPLNATDDSSGYWTLSDFVLTTSTHEFLDNPTGDNNYLVYKGHDGTKEEIENLLNGFTTSVGYLIENLSIKDESGLAIPKEELNNYVKLGTLGQNDLSAYESSKVSPQAFIVSTPSTIVEDNGLMDLVKKMMEEGYLSEAEISYDSVMVAGQNLKLMVYNYELRDELTGYETITDTQLGYLANTKSISTASKDAIPHGSKLIVNDSHSVPVSDEAIDLTSFSTLKLTGLGDTYVNVADEIAFCFKPAGKVAALGSYGIQPVYLYSETSDGEFAEVSEVKTVGYYKMCLKARQWKSSSTVEFKYSSGYGYCGEVTSNVFEVKTADADAGKRSALLEAINASEQFVSEKSEVYVVDDLGTDGNVDEKIKLAALAELENGTEYICKSDSDKIDPAIKAATSVYYNADATDAEVEQATSDLTAAKAAYGGAFKTNTVDYTGLETALANATEALAQVTESHIVSAETANDFSEGIIWMTPEDNEAMKTLIAQAEVILNPEAEEGQGSVRTASQAACDDLTTQLNTARTQTIRCKGQATVTEIDELSATLENANAKKTDIDSKIADGSLVICSSQADIDALSKDAQYILQEAYDALCTAIASAQELVNSYTANPSSVTDTNAILAKSALSDAIAGCTINTVSAKVLSESNTTITGINDEYTPKKDEDVTITPQVKYGSTVLVAGSDYTATLKIAGDNTSITPESGTYKCKVNTSSKYTLLITGIGNYSGSITKEFEVTYPEEIKDISADGAATITNVNDKYTPEKDAVVTIKPQVKYGDTTLEAGSDYTATLKNEDNTSIKAKSDNPYEYELDTINGKYTLTVEGTGNYTGSLTKEFEVTYPEDESGTVLTSEIDGKYVYLTATVNGVVTPAIGAVSNNMDIATVSVEADGRVKVACVGPGIVEVQVQISETEFETFCFMSNLTQEGADEPEKAAPVTVEGNTGIKVGGLLKSHVDEINNGNLEIKVDKITDQMSDVKSGTPFGVYDVSMYYKGNKVQPFGNITLSFPVGVETVLDEGYQAVVYHRHDNASEAKCYKADFVTAADDKYIEVTVSQFSTFEPAIVPLDITTEDPSLLDDAENINGVNTITSSDIYGVSESYLWTGSPISVNFWVTVGENQLVPMVDFTHYFTNSDGDQVDSDNIVDLGTYTLHVEGTGNYTGSASKEFEVVAELPGSVDPTNNGSEGDSLTGIDRYDDSVGSTLSSGDGSSGSGSSSGGSIVKTGDELFYLLIGLFVVAGIATGVLVKLRRGDRVDRTYR